MELTLKQAKALFILSKGSEEVMQKYYVAEYEEFLKLDIDSKTKNEWLNEMIENGVQPYSDGSNLHMASLYEARALFDLTNGEKFVMGRGYWDDYMEYEKLVSDELHQKWCQELLVSIYESLSKQETIDMGSFWRFSNRFNNVRTKENLDMAMELFEKVRILTNDDKLTLVDIILGSGSVKAKRGMALCAYKCDMREDLKSLMTCAYKLLAEGMDYIQKRDPKDIDASDNREEYIKYYQKKWEEMMDIFELDKTACIEEAKRKMKGSGEETDFREQATQDIEDK